MGRSSEGRYSSRDKFGRVNNRRVLVIFGTRPEAIKLAPVIEQLHRVVDVRTCSTGQHRDILRQVLEVFSLRPDYDLDLMQPGQSLFTSTSRIIAALESVFHDYRPDMVVV